MTYEGKNFNIFAFFFLILQVKLSINQFAYILQRINGSLKSLPIAKL